MPPQTSSRRRYVAAALATGAVVAYVAHRRGYLKQKGSWPLLEALQSYRQALLTGSQVASRLAADLQKFIESDAEEVPASLRQLLRLAQSDEAQRATEVLSSAACRGAVTGAISSATEAAAASGIRADTFFVSALEAAASERGRGLISILVATVARQAVEASIEANRMGRVDAAPSAQSGQQSFMEVLPQALAIVDSEQGSRVLCDVVASLTRGAVAAYLSDAQNAEICDSVVRTVTKPEHREGLGDLAQRVTGEAVRALVTSAVSEYSAVRLMGAGGETPAPLPLPSAWTPRPPSAYTPARFQAGGKARTPFAQRAGRAGGSFPSSPSAGGSSMDDSVCALLPGRCAACGVDGTDLLRSGNCGCSRWGTAGPSAASASAAAAAAAVDLSGDEASSASPAPAAQQAPENTLAAAPAPAAAAPDASWRATALAVLSIAAEPEARVVIRDVAGAMAGSSVKALCSVVPDAIRSVLPSVHMPSMPWRRRQPEAAQASSSRGEQAGAGPGSGSARGSGCAGGSRGASTRRGSLREIDADGEALDGVVLGHRTGDMVTERWSTMDTIKVQGTIAFALLLHAAAVVPAAAARFAG